MSSLDRGSFVNVVTSSVSVDNLGILHPTDLRPSDLAPLLTVAKTLADELERVNAEIRHLKVKRRTGPDIPLRTFSQTFPEPADTRLVCEFEGCSARSRQGHAKGDCWNNPEGNNYHPTRKTRERPARRDRRNRDTNKSFDKLVSAITARLTESSRQMQSTSKDSQDHPEPGEKQTRIRQK
ncbi:unnamed protein product [Choristocarpus tenellus]